MLPGAGALASRMAGAPQMKFSQLRVSGLTRPLEQGAGFVVSGACNCALAPEAGALPELSSNKHVPTGGNLALLEKTQLQIKRTRIS